MFQFSNDDVPSNIDFKETLRKAPQKEIMTWALGRVNGIIKEKGLELNSKIYLSPIRSHTRPDCSVDILDGIYRFSDFGDPDIQSRDCIDMVCGIFNMSKRDAVAYLKDNFNMDFVKSKDEDVEIDNTTSEKRVFQIFYDVRPLRRSDYGIWLPYGIPPESLEEDDVFPVVNFYTLSKREDQALVRVSPLVDCYAFAFKYKTKLYLPNRQEVRFLSNLTENDLFFLNKLPETGDHLVIQKSYKDAKLIRILYPNANVIALQGETMFPSKEILIDLIKRFKKITVFFDNDSQGVKSSIQLSNIINSLSGKRKARALVLPKECGQKDPSDLYKKEGKKTLIKNFNQIKLFNF